MKRIICTVIAFSVFAPLVHAQDSRVYIGGAYGRSKMTMDTSGVSNALTASGVTHGPVSADETDKGVKFFIGYRANRYFAAEAAFVDMGKFSLSTQTVFVNNIGNTIRTDVTSQVKVGSGLALSGLGILPLGNFSLFGRLGVHTLHTSYSVTNSVSASETAHALLYGAGAAFDVTRHLTLRAEFERYTDVGAGAIGKHDADLASLGVVFRF
jgi:OOP family OmpA-OmpF porin